MCLSRVRSHYERKKKGYKIFVTSEKSLHKGRFFNYYRKQNAPKVIEMNITSCAIPKRRMTEEEGRWYYTGFHFFGNKKQAQSYWKNETIRGWSVGTIKHPRVVLLLVECEFEFVSYKEKSVSIYVADKQTPKKIIQVYAPTEKDTKRISNFLKKKGWM